MNVFVPAVPKNLEELRAIVGLAIAHRGPRCDLNDNDLSKWNTSKVEDMAYLFQNSFFNGDISQWDVRHVELMEHMFAGSAFDGDSSCWRPERVHAAQYMFSTSNFNGDLSRWRLPNLSTATCMFDGAAFAGDLSSWDLSQLQPVSRQNMFSSTFQGVLPRVSNHFEERRLFYTNMLRVGRGSKGLVAYLTRTDFNAVHFDLASNSKTKPPGIEHQDWLWAQEIKKAGAALGLDERALFDYAMSNRIVRDGLALDLPNNAFDSMP